MLHVAGCIKDLKDKDNDDFKPAEVDISHCVMYMDARKTDAEGNPLLDNDRNPITKQIIVITNRDAYETARELWKHRTRRKED